jgi:hypothetical protein
MKEIEDNMPGDAPIQVPTWVMDRFPPDHRAAVDHLRRQVDEGMLREIAEADYAQDTEEHLAALKPIWSGGELGEMDSWFPREVLELIRWSEPEHKDWNPGATGVHGHQMRAFCCAILLATPNFEPEKETLIQMLDSVLVLGEDATEAVGRFLTWKIGTLGREEDRPFFALAIAGILHALEPEMTTPEEELLAQWLMDEETSERDYLAGSDPNYSSAPWLFGLSFSKMQNSGWKSLIRRIMEARQNRPLGILLAAKCKES